MKRLPGFIIHYTTLRLLCLLACFSQPDSYAQSNEPKVLPFDAFLSQIRMHHPIVKQGALQVEKATAQLLGARGGFDPQLEYSTRTKTLDGTSYYDYSNGSVKLPTSAAGISLVSGFEKAEGPFINPEKTQGSVGYLGLEVPLAKGLLLDKRRAVLQQAMVYTKQSREEQASLINDLLLEAYRSYFQWLGTYQLQQIYRGYAINARKRFELIKISFRNGDRSVSDTLEAATQWQNYELLQMEATLQLTNRWNDLTLFLWNEEAAVKALPEPYIPDTTQLNTAPSLPPLELLNEQLARHPELEIYRYKLQSLTIDKKLKFQNLLPTLDGKVNLLSKDYFQKLSLASPYLQNNYTYGVTFKLPLFQRQARGSYRESQLKIKETSLLFSVKQRELQIKLQQYYNEAASLQQQLQTALQIITSYRSLVSLEELKFSQGESSLFLVNSREAKALEAQQKYLELQLKYRKALYSLSWAAGQLHQQ
ncbi:MAG TPA: TolC family protein [Flavisolibacter sp.]|jgi:outer membrane protein TolC|nr:TolC family protein [Flavisolibacter sp.]